MLCRYNVNVFRTDRRTNSSYLPIQQQLTASYAGSQNCEKRLLASPCLSVCPSVRPHGTTRLPLDGFS